MKTPVIWMPVYVADVVRRSIRNGRASPADRVRLAGLVSMARQTKTELRQGEK
jgi:hypothetical protein